MKLVIKPTKKTANSKNQIEDLKKYLQKKGIKTDVIETKPKKGELGRGIASGLATILTGGETLFSRLGEALVKYVEGRRVDLTMKNNRGEELVLSAALPKEQIRSLVNEFFERNIAKDPAKKPVKKKPAPKKTKTTTSETEKKASERKKKPSTTKSKTPTK